MNLISFLLIGFFFVCLALFKFASPTPAAIGFAVACAAFFSKKFGRLILQLRFGAAALLVFGVCFLSAPPSLMAQVTDGTYLTLTNIPTQVTTTATTNINCWLKIVNGTGMSLSWKFNQTSASTSNAVLTVYSSVDGTNVSTVPFATITQASTGTTDVIVNTNWNELQLRAFHSLVIGSMANPTAVTTLTNKLLTVRQSN